MNEIVVDGLQVGKNKKSGTPTYVCVAQRCASKGNHVRASHKHAYVPVAPMENARREATYLRDRRKPTARQARQLRRMARRQRPK